MINQVKNLIFGTDKKRNELDRLQASLELFEEKSSQIQYCKDMMQVNNHGDNSSREFNSLPIVVHPEASGYNFIQRFITQRRNYKEYRVAIKMQQKESQRLENEVDSLEQEINEIVSSVGLPIGTNLGQYAKKIEEQLDNEEEKKTLKDVGITYSQAIRMLEENGVPIVLTPEDKEVTKQDKKYESISDFILVHKTDYYPTADRIKSDKEAGATSKEPMIIKGKEIGKIEIKNERNTVHFAVNGEVGSHSQGDWETRKYAILIPLSDIPKEKIVTAAPQDTYTKGGVELTENTYILCPKGEGEIIRKQNSKAKVVEYEGKIVTGYAQAFVSTLGYKSEIVETHNWKDKESANEFGKIIEKEGIELGIHFCSKELGEEISLKEMNAYIAGAIYMKEHGIINDMTSTEFKNENCSLPFISVGSNYVRATFVEKMERNGIIMSDVVKKIIQEYRPEESNAMFESIVQRGLEQGIDFRKPPYELQEYETVEDVFGKREERVSNGDLITNIVIGETFKALKDRAQEIEEPNGEISGKDISEFIKESNIPEMLNTTSTEEKQEVAKVIQEAEEKVLTKEQTNEGEER